ncbi:calcium-translocating P-type ATPase, SERCA-type [Candidatus Atribacteria bacterium 4572_76]|nr:MAG: calcium-translocating P-type ATPase, SERCA-type [Candidatus Atribacteria bacterium 4572_76]
MELKENKINWYTRTVKDVTQYFNVDSSKGLSSKEVKTRLEKFGPNQLKESKGRTVWDMFFDQFKEVLVLILLISVIISIFLGEAGDAIVIAVILVLNATLGVVQEFKAEKSLAALKKMTVPDALVMRNGKPTKIKSNQLVPGDIVLLEAGDRIPADLRLFKVTDIKVQEAILTGESEPVEKNSNALEQDKIPLGDRKNMAFMGTTIIAGRGEGIVVATGMDTEMGEIAGMLEEGKREPTPLQQKLNIMGKKLGLLILMIVAIIILLGCIRGIEFFDMFLIGISLAVAAVPEGLPAVVTIVLALGVQRMIKKNVIIRQLPAVETLGATTVICSDKTGTLTQNQMTVKILALPDKTIEVEGEGYQPFGQFYHSSRTIQPSDDLTISLLLKGAVLCNNAILQQNSDNQQWEIIGDPTEGALVVTSAKAGYQKKGLENEYPRIKELPFDSDRKRMSTIHRSPEESFIVFVKGAPDKVITQCKYYMENGKQKEFDDSAREKVFEQNKKLAASALRVLALAYRKLNDGEENGLNQKLKNEDIENDLIFLGLMAMIDPPRKEAIHSVDTCRKAGIQPIMITGDYSLTAKAIASQLGIYHSGDRIITGMDLENMTQEELEKVVLNTTIFARVSPRHKRRIVRALQKNRQVVAMTGDGVNDAPALKESNIGVAMGITGTDVSKEASDMILMDDNFSSIVAAVEEGRKIYQNIKKFIQYLLSCNLGEILTIFCAILIGLPRPLIPIQILWVNLVTDGLPALALGLDPAEEDLMNQMPREPDEAIFSGKMGFNIFSQGIFIGAITLVAFILGIRNYSLEIGQTMAFATLSFSQLWQSLNSRSPRLSLIKLGVLTNRYLILAILISGSLQLGVMLIPTFQQIFKVLPLNGYQWTVVILLSFSPIIYVEILKLFGLTYKK